MWCLPERCPVNNSNPCILFEHWNAYLSLKVGALLQELLSRGLAFLATCDLN
jgi:hypothetical protein